MAWARRTFYACFATAALIALVEMLVTLLDPPAYLLPRPSAVLCAMTAQSDTVWTAWTVTFGETVAGIGVALVMSFGLALGVVFLPRPVGRAINAIGVAIQSTPLLAIAPLLSLWLGKSFTAKAAAACLVSFFPLLTGWTTGLRATDSDQRQLFENLGASTWQTATYLLLPNALPYFFGGLRVAVPLSLIGAIVAEFVGAAEGIGFRILSNSYYVRTADMFGYVVLAGLTGWGLNCAVAVVEKRVLFWHGQRGA